MGVRITVQSLWPEADTSTYVYEFAQSKILIGRSRSADVQLPHRAVSATHATIRAQSAGYVLIDEGSTNGTRINEVLIAPGRPKMLRTHDRVDLGGYRLTLDVGVPIAQPTSARQSTEHAKSMITGRARAEPGLGPDAELVAIQAGPDEQVDLLPIANEAPNDPPRAARESRPSRPRTSRPDGKEPAPAPVKLGRSEVAVYALAVIVLATSVVAMALLMQR
jgi:predicted component of type VI protein secretion system